jgi:two-component system, NtrC family, sensor histidine kinase KinB
MAQKNPQKSLDLLYSISKELSASLDLTLVLEKVLALCTRNVNAERGLIVALDESLKPINSALIINQKSISHTPQEMQSILDHGLAGWVLRNHQSALVSDTSNDNRWFRRPDDDVNRTGAKSAICIPLIMAEDRVVGILTIVHPQPGFFNENHMVLLQVIADQAAITIYNARLYQSLEKAEQRYQTLFEESIDPILVTDWKGQIIETNRRATEMFSLKQNELLKKSIFDLHSIDWDWLGTHAENLHNNETLTYVSEVELADNENLPIEVYIHKVMIGDGEYLQWIIRNISERKKLDKLREELSAMVYHDLRSPLSNVLSSLDMLSSIIPQDASESANQLVQIAIRSTHRVQRLISSLLDINRLENGQSIVHQNPTDLIEVIHEAIDAVQINADTKGQNIHCDVPVTLPAVWIDHDIIKRVFINLFENAIKFAPPGGNIWVNGQLKKDEFELWVQDDGPGIPTESHEFIFEKYAYLNKDKFPKGIGLGLAFCRMAVQAHGGQIWVESSPSQGSRFVFTLPAGRPI